MVHSFYQIYGAEKVGMLLTGLSSLLTAFIRNFGFSLGMDSLVMKPQALDVRQIQIQNAHQNAIQQVAKLIKHPQSGHIIGNFSNRINYQLKQENKSKDNQQYSDFIQNLNRLALPQNLFQKSHGILKDSPLLQHISNNLLNIEQQQPKEQDSIANTIFQLKLDNIIKTKANQGTSNIIRACIPQQLLHSFPRNRLSLIVNSGAKGGPINQSQITCLLGQQELEGKRVPVMATGRTLPSFLPYDPNPRSGGYITDRFLSGLRPQDYYFHCMAGRQGLVDTAVKTSRSGYLQRCLIKSLEVCVADYDYSVRDNGGSIVQFIYGEDGIDVSQSKYIEKFKFLAENSHCYDELARLQTNSQQFKGILQYFQNTEANYAKKWKLQQIERVEERRKKLDQLSQIQQQKKGDKVIFKDNQLSIDPILAHINPAKYFGVVSDKYANHLKEFLASRDIKPNENAQNLQESKKSKKKKKKVKKGTQQLKFNWLSNYKYFKSLIHPGQNVGTVAAQSVGEPSTQMTLNTFHLAGYGAGVNVTLGIPRLREILMTANINIKTPTMTLPLKMINYQTNERITKKQAEKTASLFKKVKLKELVKKFEVIRYMQDKNFRDWVYEIKIYFEDLKQIQKHFNIKEAQLYQIVKTKFSLRLNKILARQTKVAMKSSGIQVRLGKINANQDRMRQSNHDNQAQNQQDIQDPGSSSKQQEDLPNRRQQQDAKIIDEQKQKEEMKQDFQLKQDSQIQEEIQQDSLAMGNAIEQSIKYIRGLKPLAQQKMKQSSLIKQQKFKDSVYQFLIKIPLAQNGKKLLIKHLVQKALDQILVTSVNGIKDSYLVQRKSDDPGKGQEYFIETEGVNFNILWKLADKIEIDKVMSTDIYKILQFYGVSKNNFFISSFLYAYPQIEACRNMIVKQVLGVFGHYGINVDFRHLSLIADFMTQNGKYRPFNRMGMEESSSPLLKMSFETTGKYLADAALNREVDWGSNTSARLVLGQPAAIGTGYFDILMDSQK